MFTHQVKGDKPSVMTTICSFLCIKTIGWQAIGMLGYDVSKSTTIFAGYRAIDLDYEKRGDELDLTFHGPVVGVDFRF